MAHLALLMLLVLAAYGNTFGVPFHLDDVPAIKLNPLVREMGYYFGDLDPSNVHGRFKYESFRTRKLVFFTFALNYMAHGYDVWGYHAVNIALHAMNAMLVYLVARMLLGLAVPSAGQTQRAWASFLAAALFAAHPVQTGAVTYIWQRSALLGTLFYLACVLCYLRYRFSPGGRARWAWYALALASAIAGMKAKETVFTLPLVILALELMLLRNTGPAWKARLLPLLPFALTMFIIPLSLMGIGMPVADVLSAVDDATRVGQQLGRWEYFITESRVLVTYLRLLLLPISLNVDYAYPLKRHLADAGVIASMAILAAMAIYGIRGAIRGRGPSAAAGFGALWFFLALSVESSFIPLVRVIFEHRLYLPMAGLSMAASAVVLMAYPMARPRFALPVLAAALVLVMAASAHARNRAWATEESLWRDVVAKSPTNAMALLKLGVTLQEHGRTQEAIGYYGRSLRINPDFFQTHYSIASAYAAKGQNAMAREHYIAAIRLNPAHAWSHFNLANLYMREGNAGEAVKHYAESARIEPRSFDVRFAYARALIGRDDGRALAELNEALRLRPGHAGVLLAMGRVYLAMGRPDRAAKAFGNALGSEPDNSEARRGVSEAMKAMASKSK